MLATPAIRPLLSVFLSALLLTASPLASADSVNELRELVERSDSAAWSMATRMEDQHAGDPEFDFWYGLAAKAAGKPQQAVFAFERVVANQPGNARARLELAEALFQFGNRREARRLFDEVLATTPPEPVQQRIRSYQQAMESADKAQKTSVTGFVTLAGGHDSNISSTTDVATHDYLLVPITLQPQSLEADAGFVELRAGLNVVQPVNQRTLRFLTVNAQRRDNERLLSGNNFDYTTLGASGGWLLRRGAATWRIPLNVQALWAESPGAVNDDRYVFSAGIEYNRPLTSRTAVTWFGQGGNMHYPSEENRNAWMAVVGGGYTWNSAQQPLRVMTTLHLGTEPTEESGQAAEMNGRDYAALRANLRRSLSSTQSLYGAVGVQYSEYHDEIALSTWGVRKELLADVSLGWQLQLDRNWSVNLDLAHAVNASRGNELFDYDRTQVKLGSTWRF